MENIESNYYKNSRPEIVDFIPAKIERILDIGCSSGEFLKLVKLKTNAETWGVEINPYVAEQAKKNVDTVICGKVEDMISQLPFGYFDCITLNDVLEHLVNPNEVLELLIPKLKADGIIVASIPNVRYIDNLYAVVVKKDWEYKEEGILDSTHLRFFTKKSMVRLFMNCGMKVKLQKGINPTTSKRFKVLNILTLGFFRDAQYLQFINIVTH